MKMFILSDNKDALIGMRLAGIDGRLVHTPEDVQNVLDNDFPADTAILLMTRSLAEHCQALVNDLKQKNRPLLVEIPNKENCAEGSDSITRYVRDAMGIKI